MDVLFESIRALCLIKDSGCILGVHQSSVSDKGQWVSFWSPSELCAREKAMDVLFESIRALCLIKDSGCPF